MAYTDHAVDVMEERAIDPRWVETTLATPEWTVRDSTWPDRRHALRRIPERGDRVLRVVYTESTTQVLIVTVFFDRRMRSKS